MNYCSPIQPWLDRSGPLQSFLDLSNLTPTKKFGAFLSFEFMVPVHEAGTLSEQSLSESWKKTESYVKKALKLVGIDTPGIIDSEEALLIQETLGSPPSFCYPIYMCTVGSGNNERVVYFGKTSSKTKRFSSGHAALTKLNAPKFDGMQKYLYQGCIILLTAENDYLPLEWVHPYIESEKILKNVEAQLIYRFDPELNTNSKDKNNATNPLTLHIENYTGKSEYLHEYIIEI